MTALGLIGAGMLIYGCLVESNNLVTESCDLHLPTWPEDLDGYKIAVLADLHVRDEWSYRLACQAIDLAIAANPDMILLPGDFLVSSSEFTVTLLESALAPLLLMRGKVIASLGNHDLRPDVLKPVAEVLDNCEIRTLRNQVHRQAGITWVGIDSQKYGTDNAAIAMDEAKAAGNPIVVMWHEPDMVDQLPEGASLMISGHSHGGQFTFPGGFTPMHTKHGKKYVRGFYPDAKTPLYVSRGIGTTGPPSRFLCPPELSLLTLKSSK